MTPKRFQQIDEVLEAAADVPPEERGAVLDRLCRDDAVLRAEVEALLAGSTDTSPGIPGAIGRAAGGVAITPRLEGDRHLAEGALLQRGELVGERFTIERLAEVGGMGEVYRAIDEHGGEAVAIKVLRRDRSQDVRRFEREAQLLAAVEHPHIVRHVAHGRLASGEPYLAMEWLEGETLAERLERQRLTTGEAVRLGLDLAETLGALHRRGIVHRDLKPSNVLLVGGAVSELRLLDLGIAWNSAWSALTQTGMFVGSVRYAAPEQVLGARFFDSATDVFSLGVVLFECLAGAPAFDDERPIAVLTRIALGELPRLRDRTRGLPEPLLELVDRMLASEPELRPSDGDEVARALAALGEITDLERAAEGSGVARLATAPTAIESPAAAIRAEPAARRSG